MGRKAALIRGDGIGPEVTGAALHILEAAGVTMEWEEVEAGIQVVPKYGKPLPDQAIESIRKNRVALKGPLTTLIGEGFPSVNVELRKKLELYANLRPVRNVAGVKSRFENVDLVIIRENTEDLYSGLEHMVAPGVAQSLKIITREASQRVARFAFEYACSWGRKRVTAVHKANILKVSDGLFLENCREVSEEFSGITYEEIIVDNLSMQLVLNPAAFRHFAPDQYVRRHCFRSMCGVGGWFGFGRGGQCWGEVRGFRGRSRECSGHRWKESGQSSGPDLHQCSDVASPWHDRPSGSNRKSCAGGHRGRGSSDPRPGREGLHYGNDRGRGGKTAEVLKEHLARSVQGATEESLCCLTHTFR